MIDNEIKMLRMKYTSADADKMTQEEIETVRKAYADEGVIIIHTDIPNFKDTLISGPDAEQAAKWFKEQITGFSGIGGLGTAIAVQFNAMKKFDVIVEANAK